MYVIIMYIITMLLKIKTKLHAIPTHCFFIYFSFEHYTKPYTKKINIIVILLIII